MPPSIAAMHWFHKTEHHDTINHVGPTLSASLRWKETAWTARTLIELDTPSLFEWTSLSLCHVAKTACMPTSVVKRTNIANSNVRSHHLWCSCLARWLESASLWWVGNVSHLAVFSLAERVEVCKSHILKQDRKQPNVKFRLYYTTLETGSTHK